MNKHIPIAAFKNNGHRSRHYATKKPPFETTFLLIAVDFNSIFLYKTAAKRRLAGSLIASLCHKKIHCLKIIEITYSTSNTIIYYK